MTEEEIAEGYPAGETQEEDSEENDEEEVPVIKPKLSVVRGHIDFIINYIDISTDREVQAYYEYFRAFREIIICSTRI